MFVHSYVTPTSLASLALSTEHSRLHWEVLGWIPDTVGHLNNVGSSVRLKTSFEPNPITTGKQGTLPFLCFSWTQYTTRNLHIPLTSVTYDFSLEKNNLKSDYWLNSVQNKVFNVRFLTFKYLYSPGLPIVDTRWLGWSHIWGFILTIILSLEYEELTMCPMAFSAAAMTLWNQYTLLCITNAVTTFVICIWITPTCLPVFSQ